MLTGMPGQVDPGIFAVQMHIRNDQVHSPRFDNGNRMVIILDCGGDAETRLLQRMFIVEGDQWLIFHHQYAVDRLAPSPSQPPEKHLPIRPLCAMQPLNAVLPFRLPGEDAAFLAQARWRRISACYWHPLI